MTYAEQLERETEEARTSLSNSLDELRSRITPGQLIDQLTDGLKDGAPGEFARNLKDHAVKNPLPVAVMGISLAWMMLGSRTGSGHGVMHRAADRIREAAGTVASSARSTADGVIGKASEWTPGASDSNDVSRHAADGKLEGKGGKGDGSWVNSALQNAGDMAESARNAVGSVAGSAQRAASETFEGVAETRRQAAASISDTTRAAGRRTFEAGHSIVELCREQPLLTTAIGIALGVFLGALAPSTKLEDRVMGDTSDQLKEDAKDFASEQYDRVEKMGEEVLGAQENRELGASAAQACADASVDTQSAGRSDRVTLVPDELTSPAEPYGQPTNADRAPI
jgi:ElaB/YqjD/DUF883 family membrane-anchored ribosome-binding protein